MTKKDIRRAYESFSTIVRASVELSGSTSTDWKDKSAKVYMDDSPFPEDLGLMDRPAFSVYGEDPENDKRWKQYRKLEVQIYRAIIESVNSKIAELFGFEDYKLLWNIYCGCSMCPCSSGFNVVKGSKRVKVERGNVYKVWVKFKNPKVVAARKASAAEREYSKFDAAI